MENNPIFLGRSAESLLLFDFEVGFRGSEFITAKVFHGKDEFVFPRLNILRHVDHVNQEEVSSLAAAEVWLHGQCLLDDAFSLGIPYFVASFDFGFESLADFLTGHVFQFAVQKNLLVWRKGVLVELVGHTESVDLGTKDWGADLQAT